MSETIRNIKNIKNIMNIMPHPFDARVADAASSLHRRAAHTAALHGRVSAAPDDARIRLVCGTRCSEVQVCQGHWGCFGLPAGRYRVEYIARRMVLAQDVDVLDGREIENDFDL